MSIEHKSTAKASLRDLLSAHGKAGVLLLLGEVLREELPVRRGRPTRAQTVTRLALAGLESTYQAIANAEDALVEKEEGAE
jgi:hypothetical protein